MSKKSENFYFNNFIESAAVACEAADFLKSVLSDFKEGRLPEDLKKIHTIEHKGDGKKHEMTAELVHSFITPIERDDITTLVQNIDDVTDAIEDVLVHLYINNIKTIRADALKFTEVIIECCSAMKDMFEEFRNFKKSKKLKDAIIDINHLEEEGDKIYLDAMRQLHTTEKDPMQVIAWREIYGFLEKCCDACEDVADVVESITIGNT